MWRRTRGSAELVREDVLFRPWLLLDSLVDLEHLGPRLARETEERPPRAVTFEELARPGRAALPRARRGWPRARRRRPRAAPRAGFGRDVRHLRELADDDVPRAPARGAVSRRSRAHVLPRPRLRAISAALQFDLETTGLDPRVAIGSSSSPCGAPDGSHPRRWRWRAKGTMPKRICCVRFAACIRELDPDVIENHNLHGFDLPFLAQPRGDPRRAARARPRRAPGLAQRPAARGARSRRATGPSTRCGARATRYAGRELIDTLDAVPPPRFRRARSAGPRAQGGGAAPRPRARRPRAHPRRARPRGLPPRSGARAPLRDRRRARGGGARARCSAARRSRWRAWRRAATSGSPTRAPRPASSIRCSCAPTCASGTALPAHEAGDGTAHTGAALHLFAAGVAQPRGEGRRRQPLSVAHARVPHRPARATGSARCSRSSIGWWSSGSRRRPRARRRRRARRERHGHEALSAAMKLVVNSAYGYLAAASASPASPTSTPRTRSPGAGARCSACCAASSRRAA